MSSFNLVGSFNKDALIGVSIAPGAMLLIRMPLGASSIDKLRVNIFIAPLEAQYAVNPGKGRSSCTDEILMIVPRILELTHLRTNACAQKKGPFKFTSMTLS